MASGSSFTIGGGWSAKRPAGEDLAGHHHRPRAARRRAGDRGAGNGDRHCLTSFLFLAVPACRKAVQVEQT